MRGVPKQVWLGYIAAGLAVTATYYLVPVSGAGPVIRVVLYTLVSASSSVAIAVRYRWGQGPRTRLPWLLLGLGQAVYASADLAFYVAHYLLHSVGFPSVPDVLYLAHYPFVLTALAILIRRRNPERDLAGLLDAAVLAVTAALLSWVFLIGPQARAELTLLVKMASLAYPVMDLAMLAVALRLVLGPGRRPFALLLLAGSLFAIFAADTVYGLQQLNGTYRTGGLLDAIWLTGNLALGAAALHPTACRIHDVGGPGPGAGFGRVRMVAVTAAGLAGPVLLLAKRDRFPLDDLTATACAWAVLFVLILLRLHGVLAEQRRVAVTDELTGLYTRRYFQGRLASAAARARRGSGEVALFMVDVDHFKRVNDRYGHPAGDRVLAEIAARLRAAAGPHDLLARYGGEEFALLTTSVPVEGLAAVCQRLRRRVAGRPIPVVAGTEIAVTVSVGVASGRRHGATPEHLVTVADKALYRAKACGRDRAVIGDAAVTGETRVAGGGPVAADEPVAGDAAVASPSPGGGAPGSRLSRVRRARLRLPVLAVPRQRGPVLSGHDLAAEPGWSGLDQALPGQPAFSRAGSALNPAPMMDFLRIAADRVDRCLSGHEHSRPVGRWSGVLAMELGYDEDTVLRAELAGRLHDVGKIVIPADLLAKPGALSDEEWRVLRQHPDQGARLVSLIPGFEEIAEIVRQHHERFDGGGYPRRLTGAAIVPEARILAVCDSWAAMRSDRSYQGAMAVERAADELRRGRGAQYDPQIVDAFLDLHELGRVGDLPRIGAGSDHREPQPATV